MLKGRVIFASGCNLERPHNRTEERSGDEGVRERPRLVKGEPFDYECSRCGQAFLLPEDRTPKEGVLEVWAAFQQHVAEEHPEDAEGSRGGGNGASENTQR